MSFPANLTAGDSASWIDVPFMDATGKSYDSRTYALRYELRGPGSPVTINAASSGGGWQSTLTPTISTGMVAGTWFWAAILTATNERITIARGEVNVAPDITAQVANFDGRSQAERALADAEAALASFKSSQGKIKKYVIGSRQMEFATIPELLECISYWRVRVINERKARGVADGLGNPSNLMVRFR